MDMRFRLSTLLFLAVAAAAAMPACSCGGDDEASSGTNGSGPGSGGGGGNGPAASVRVDPAAATLTVELGGAPATQAYKAFATVNGAEVEVTADCDWMVDPGFGSISGGTLTAAARGGTTQVVASCSGATGASDLTIDLAGTILVGAAPADAPDLFDAAPAGSDPARTPVTVYPIDGAIAPRNLPPIDVQWQAAANDLFHVALSAPNLAIDLYTTDLSAMLQDAEWDPIVSTAAGEDLQIEVEGLLLTDPSAKFASAPVTFRISNDNLDKTALYYWASSKSSLMTQTFGATTAPAELKGECTSCHSVSRSGSRIGYSRCVGDCNTIRVGFMRFDKGTNTWLDTVNANHNNPPPGPEPIVGSYTTFAPVGNPFPDDSQSVALVGMSSGTLQLYNPDTGFVVPSNLADVANDDTEGMPTRSALMPDWSPDGKQVVFASTPDPGQWIDLSDGAIAVMNYTYDGTNHAFEAPKFIVTPPLTWPSGTYTNLFFPSFSPDGQYIVFNAARAAWRNNANAAEPGQRLALTDKAGSQVVELTKMNGEGDLDITWPHWAPTTEGEYLWVVFSSQRNYGHKVTADNSNLACKQNGVLQCKQLWIGAVDRQKLAAGLVEDPSAPPVWMPGQDLDADNISPYWTVPTSEIPE